MQRRQFLTAAASAATAVLSSGCDPAPRTLAGGFAGVSALSQRMMPWRRCCVSRVRHSW